MEELNMYLPGSQVQVTSYGPFWGLNGTIRMVDNMADDLGEPFCLYQIVLEGIQIKEPMWFEQDEVALVTDPLVALEA